MARRSHLRARSLSLTGAALACVLALGACSSQGSSEQVVSDQAFSSEGTYAESMPSEAGAFPADRTSIIRTGTISVVVDDVAGAEESVTEIVQSSQGRIDTRDVSKADNGTVTTLVARIPADGFEAALVAIGELGEVTSIYENATDVTMQVIDLDARIATLTDSISRLRELQSQAATVTDLVAIESELTTRQAELESLTSQRNYLQDQVSFSTLTITLSPETVRTTDVPDFASGLINGWYALLGLLSGAITALGFIIPFAVPVILLVLVIRLIKRRKRVQ